MKLFGIVLALLVSATVSQARQKCGVEMWPKKTLADSEATKVLAEPIIEGRSIAQLGSRPAPTRQQIQTATKRFAEETHTYRTRAYVVGYKLEADGDYHIVLGDPADPKKTMIVEMPDPACGPFQYVNLFAGLRAQFDKQFSPPAAKFRPLKKPVLVTAEGVGFFDFCHGGRGAAANCFEFHPVTSLVPVPLKK